MPPARIELAHAVSGIGAPVSAGLGLAGFKRLSARQRPTGFGGFRWVALPGCCPVRSSESVDLLTTSSHASPSYLPRKESLTPTAPSSTLGRTAAKSHLVQRKEQHASTSRPQPRREACFGARCWRGGVRDRHRCAGEHPGRERRDPRLLQHQPGTRQPDRGLRVIDTAKPNGNCASLGDAAELDANGRHRLPAAQPGPQGRPARGPTGAKERPARKAQRGPRERPGARDRPGPRERPAPPVRRGRPEPPEREGQPARQGPRPQPCYCTARPGSRKSRRCVTGASKPQQTGKVPKQTASTAD